MVRENKLSEDLEVVFQAPDQITADLVQSFLVAEGIPSVQKPRKRSNAGAEGRLFGRKYDWGDIAAPPEYANQCREIINAYMAGVPEDEMTEEAK